MAEPGHEAPPIGSKVAVRFDKISKVDQERITCHILSAHRQRTPPPRAPVAPAPGRPKSQPQPTKRLDLRPHSARCQLQVVARSEPQFLVQRPTVVAAAEPDPPHAGGFRFFDVARSEGVAGRIETRPASSGAAIYR
jgi:hypothetical protein